MNYRETLDYLFTQLPMFHRVGAAAYKADLGNTLRLCEILDHPEKKFRSVHIAGTNGKGSVSCMLAAVLQQAGYKTGLFTSPHLKDFRERIRINGKMIDEESVSRFVEKHLNDFDEIKPSFFEWTAALAFDYFAGERVEIAIMETGMGGRLDSTNVIQPELSVITNIGWDHMQFLGDSLEKIAVEKAGIIKQNTPVVIGEIQEQLAKIFTDIAAEKNASLVFAPLLWEAHKAASGKKNPAPDQLELDILYRGTPAFENLSLGLGGNYQKKNILTVLQSISMLRAGGFQISDDDIRDGIKNVRPLSGIRGRWEILGKNPLIIADTAHNKDGLSIVLEQVSAQIYKHLHFVIGMVNDKDVKGILSLFPEEATYYFCKADIPRAMEAEKLRLAALDHGLKGEAYDSVSSAFEAAKKSAQNEDLIYVGGSTFVVAEVL